MTPASLARLLLLSAIWGGSFLLMRIGAPALSVTFLIPLFGTGFGWLFLDETIGWHTLAGGAVVIVGTALVTGFSPRLLFPRTEAAHG